MGRRFHWVALVVSGGLAAGAGLLAGGAVGIRERGALKTQQAVLASELRQTQDLLTEAGDLNRDLEARNRQLAADVKLRQEEIERLSAAAEPMGEFHPPMISDPDAEIAARIAELECEVAALKEQQGMITTGAGPLLPVLAADANVAQPSDVPVKLVAKERCTALTRKGVQCTRPARLAGKCWQHGG